MYFEKFTHEEKERNSGEGIVSREGYFEDG